MVIIFPYKYSYVSFFSFILLYSSCSGHAQPLEGGSNVILRSIALLWMLRFCSVKNIKTEFSGFLYFLPLFSWRVVDPAKLLSVLQVNKRVQTEGIMFAPGLQLMHLSQPLFLLGELFYNSSHQLILETGECLRWFKKARSMWDISS